MKIKTHVKKGDQVQIIAGNSKGKTGTVLSVDAVKGKVVVENARTMVKATRKSEANPDGGLIESDGPVHISNVKKLG
ncbi:50S ribosomal protein L24 [Luteolibacter sp. Populi]|uniref:50S ribosomal protein L24 n=1 Tax=Luteolibacter sp. Populi TaxID=3230487 RepID=UPI003465EEC9